MGIVFKATDARTRALQAAEGQWIDHSDFDEWTTGFNSNPQAVQITTVTVSDPGDSTDISIVINGFTVTTNTGTGNDATAIAVLIAAQINADSRVRGQVIASSSSTTLTLTGLTPGLAFTATENDAALSSVTTTQAAATADAVSPARAIVSLGYQASEAEELVALAKSSLFTAQVATFTTTYVASAIVRVRVYEIRGAERELLGGAQFTSATDLDTTLDGLVAALNLAVPADTVLFAANAATATAIVATAEVAGLEFAIEMEHVSGGASVPAFTVTDTTGPSVSTSFHRAFRGISLRPQDEEVSTVGSTSPTWPANAGLRIATKGKLTVGSAEAVTAGGNVFVELGVTADNGKFFTSDSATRLRVERRLLTWLYDGQSSTDNLAAVRLNVT